MAKQFKKKFSPNVRGGMASRPLSSNASKKSSTGSSKFSFGSASSLPTSSNPFEVLKNKRPKHEVLGRRIKGGDRDVARARLKSDEARTGGGKGGAGGGVGGLLEEFKKRTKVNSFVDRRFGENDDDLTVDEKMMERFRKERIARSKKASIYNLDDADTFTSSKGKSSSKSSSSSSSAAAPLTLTHKGAEINPNTYMPSKTDLDDYLSSDDDDGPLGNLDKADTELHFGGGGKQRRAADANPYGPSGAESSGRSNIADKYRSRKQELEDVIKQHKMAKFERQKEKEEQVDAFGAIDDAFGELRGMLNFRDREKEKEEEKKRLGKIIEAEKLAKASKDGKLSVAPREGDGGDGGDSDDDWDREMRSYLFSKKGAATDRSKTAEEIAKEEAEKLRVLEEKRVRRMNGNFEGDDLKDVVIKGDEKVNRSAANRAKKAKEAAEKRGKKVVKSDRRNDDELDSEDERDEGGIEARFTADGLKYFDKKTGKMVAAPKVEQRKGGDDDDDNVEGAASDDDDDDDDDEDKEDGDDDDEDDEDGDEDEEEDEEEDEDEGEGEEGDSDDENDDGMGDSEEDASDNGEDDEDDFAPPLKVGMKIKANFRASEQFGGKEAWYGGVITGVDEDDEGRTVYDVKYADGDSEQGVRRKDIKVEGGQLPPNDAERATLRLKMKTAREIARKSMPFTFGEPPKTLDALDELVGEHCATGLDVITLIDRIHKSNSVRLNSKNITPMQNFYDVLLRRLNNLGDSLFENGNGAAEEVHRHAQIDALVKTLFRMSGDHPETAGAVFGRRVGVLQRALQKRLNDASMFIRDDGSAVQPDNESFTSWPSMGAIMLLRAVGTIFPVTDKEHKVVTPCMVLLGQCVGQCGVRKSWDLVRGLLCSGLMLDFSREAGRVVPEAISFVSGVLRLFSGSTSGYEIPTLEAAARSVHLQRLRESATASASNLGLPLLLQSTSSEEVVAAGVFTLAVDLAQKIVDIYGSKSFAPDVLSTLQNSAAALRSANAKLAPLPARIADKIAALVASLDRACSKEREPLQLRKKATVAEAAIKSLAPRMAEPEDYKMSKDKSKEAMKAQRDKLSRQFKREKKAAARELKLDGKFIEAARRDEKDSKLAKDRAARHKNFAWMEQEQATINQQVREGGGLMKGGGAGVGKAVAKRGKVGMKKARK